MKQTRILIVDDHENVRQGLHAFIRTYPTLIWVGEAANGEEAVRLCAELEPDLVLMDVMMPKMDGITATRLIHREQPHIRILALSNDSEYETIQQMMKAGAVGYVFKNGFYDDLASVLGVAQPMPEQPLVLIAEDDPHLRGLFAKVLRLKGFQVSLATTSQDVLNQLEYRLPDVLILDLGLPGAAGLDLIQHIHDCEGGHHVRIMVVTGNHMAQRSPQAELVDLFLLKPVSPFDIAEFVQRFLEHKAG